MPATPQARPDFSPMHGGAFFRFLRRSRLSGDALELTRRRTLILSGVAWLPLLLLSAGTGRLAGDALDLPFLRDIETHVCLLIALPLLIGAEVFVHRRIAPVARRLAEGDLLAPESVQRLHRTMASIARVRDSVNAEVALLMLVYALGFWVWQNQVALGAATWYAHPAGAGMKLTAAGGWYFFVSLPVFQFLLFRWYLRFLLWCGFLVRVSRLELRLVPTHPDKTGGLGFLADSGRAFLPILLAQGVLLAGLLASQILYWGAELTHFRLHIAVYVALFVLAVLSPLAVFAPQLARAKWQALEELSRLGNRYAQAFEAKWMRGSTALDGELLGSADIQTLADLGSSYELVQGMRIVPFSLKDAVWLAVATAVPLLPLTLTMFSPQELVSQLIKVLF